MFSINTKKNTPHKHTHTHTHHTNTRKHIHTRTHTVKMASSGEDGIEDALHILVSVTEKSDN